MDKADIVYFPGTDEALTVRMLSIFNLFPYYFLN